MVRAKTSSKRKRRPVKRPKDEPQPVLAGRLWIAVALLVAMWLFPFPLANVVGGVAEGAETPVNMRAWTAGESENIRITLITADYDRLACALDREIGGAHCEWKTQTEAWPTGPSDPIDNNKKSVIQPYSSSPGNNLILVAGLWAQPEVAMRLHSEPWVGVPDKKLARFIVDCWVKPIEQLNRASLRWKKGAKWGSQGPAWVAIAEKCKVVEE